MALADAVFSAINRPSVRIEGQIIEKRKTKLVLVNPNNFSMCFCVMSSKCTHLVLFEISERCEPSGARISTRCEPSGTHFKT